MRRAAKKDTTHQGIVNALRDVGARVLVLDTFDLLIHFQGRLFMVDCKTPTSKAGSFRKRSLVQARLEQDGWPLHYVITPWEALEVIGAIKAVPGPVARQDAGG